MNAVFVGHPLADSLPLVNDTAAARAALGLKHEEEYIALLPGSRGGEVNRFSAQAFCGCALICEVTGQGKVHYSSH